MSDSALLEVILPISILAQLAAAMVAIRLIPITGKPLAWSLIATALVCMTVRRIIPFCLLLCGYPPNASLANESIGLLISLLMFAGMMMVGGIFRAIQRVRNKVDIASRRLQDASVAGKVVLWEWDITTGVREWSNLVDDMLGFPPNGFPRSYRAWEARIHPNDLAGVQDAIRSNFETNAPYDITYRIQCADGTYVWWHEVGHVNRDRNGTPVSLAGASVDITERMQHEEEYATIVQTAMDGIVIASAPVLSEMELGVWQRSPAPVSEPALTAWLDAVAVYSSQISTFWSGVEEMKLAVKNYWAGGGGRLWQKN